MEKQISWNDLLVGELGLLSEEYDVVVDGDLKVVKLYKRGCHE